MKRLVTILILLCAVQAFAQPVLRIPSDTVSIPSAHAGVPFIAAKGNNLYVYNAELKKWILASGNAVVNKDSVGSVVKMGAINSVSELRTSSLHSIGVIQTFTTGYTSANDGGGAPYYFDPFSFAADDSMFTVRPSGIAGHLPGRWKLQVNGPVNALQIGMRFNSSYPGGFGLDNSNILKKFDASPYYHLDFSSTGTYSFSSGAMTSSAFYFSERMEFSKRVVITGAGKNNTILFAPKGMIIRHDNTELARFTLIQNWGQGSPTFNSSTEHGVYVRSNGNRFVDVRITGFAGDGWNVESGIGVNCNNNSWDYCDAWFNGRFGFYAKGADANSLSINNGYWDFNARVGIHYSGFLGIKITSTHAASNGHAHPLNKSVVMHNGQAYAALLDNKNVRPDSTGASAYWQAVNIAPIFYTTWNRTDSFYWGAVAYAFTDANPRSDADNLYFENDQVPMIDVSGRTKVDNGELANYTKQFIRVESGRLTTNELQTIKPDGDRLLMTPTAGNADNTGFIGYENGFGVRFGFDFKNLDWIKLGSIANSDDGADFIVSPSASTFWNNLFFGNTAPLNGSHSTIAFRNGFVVGVDGNFPGSRLAYATAAPLTGWHRAGEFLIYHTPAASDTIGFRCTTSGTPGTWVAVRSGMKSSSLIGVKYADSTTTTGSAQTLMLRSAEDRLTSDGDALEITAMFSASASGQTVKLYLDGQELCAYLTTSATIVQLKATVIRTGSNSVRVLYTTSAGAVTSQGYADVSSINFSTALVAATGTAPTGTVTLVGATIEHKPLNQ